MALLYDPGKFMPRSRADFDGMSWMLSWPDGPWHLHDVEPGGTVLLVDSGPAQRIVWETRVTYTFGLPYEAVDDLAAEVYKRWGVVIETPDMAPGGFCIGGQAEPIARPDRGPRDLPERLKPAVGEELDLVPWFAQSAHMSAAFRYRWGIPTEPEVMCSGRVPIGWSGPDTPGRLAWA
jgi:hypothetical protein